MIDIDDLAAQVRRNCRISDARSWGYHSVCGLLLRLRELYKWEHGMEPWERTETREVMEWIGPIETRWAELEGAELEPLLVGGERVDPFDAEAVNARISAQGWFYAAGHGMAMKPLFVLGRVLDRRCVEGCNVVVLGRELVRDLSPVPAMNRGGLIVARAEAMKWFLWVWLEEAAMKKGTNLGALALARDGVSLMRLVADPAAHGEYLEALTLRELEAAIRHEIGEIAEERRSGGRWGRAFGLSCGTKAELLARGLKDVLADTGEGGRLEYIIGREAVVSLGLYAAFNEGLRRRLFPELGDLFLGLLDDGDWGRVEEARQEAHRRLRRYVGPLLEVFEGDLSGEEASRRADALEEEMLG